MQCFDQYATAVDYEELHKLKNSAHINTIIKFVMLSIS